MDWLAIVSLTVGTISILAAIAAITLSVLIHIKTQGVLADIKERAAVIEETVKGTQGKLLEAVTAIAVPPKASEQEMLMQMLGPILASNPELVERLMSAAATERAVPGRRG